jgi:hypothetical protein
LLPALLILSTKLVVHLLLMMLGLQMKDWKTAGCTGCEAPT